MPKMPARSMTMPEDLTGQSRIAPQEQVVEEEVLVDNNAQPNPFPNAPQESKEQADKIVGAVNSYIYGEGSGDIISEMKKGKDKLPETIGKIGGNLLSTEMMMEEEEGFDVPRDVYIDMQADVVHELTEVAVHEKIVDFKDDYEAQIFMGEALTHAVNTGIESDESGVTGDWIVNEAQEMLRGQDAQQPAPVTGRRIMEGVV
jgi:DNA-binding HxlR family transcriptional regulator